MIANLPSKAHIHLEDGKLVRGKMVHIKCPASLGIYVPEDKEIRKAIIVPEAGIPHNHPSFPLKKLTRSAAVQYEKVLAVLNKPGLSITEIDNSMHLFTSGNVSDDFQPLSLSILSPTQRSSVPRINVKLSTSSMRLSSHLVRISTVS